VLGAELGCVTFWNEMCAVLWIQCAVFIQVKGVLKCEGSAAQCTPVTSVPVVKTTRFHLPHSLEGDSSVQTVSMMCDCNASGYQSLYYRIFHMSVTWPHVRLHSRLHDTPSVLRSQVELPSIDPLHITHKFLDFLCHSFSLYNHTDVSSDDLC
jgi:hypothetical protein